VKVIRITRTKGDGKQQSGLDEGRRMQWRQDGAERMEMVYHESKQDKLRKSEWELKSKTGFKLTWSKTGSRLYPSPPAGVDVERRLADRLTEQTM